ncbi:MAG: DUF2817 domain-containing protein [Halobacteriovoraceae bacterium]|nr:DUF2817 domain-containing protein [Halobacteriovoraceae bacterium]
MDDIIRKKLPELIEIESLAANHPDIVKIEKLAEVPDPNRGLLYPIYGLVIGNSEDRTLPTFGLFGGVHGLERIGSQIICSYLYTLNKRLTWDRDLISQLKKRRIVLIPIVNPWGVVNRRRSNFSGVDLMRNAPLDAEGKPTPLVGGHHISPKLPWYRGQRGSPMEKEAQTLVDFVVREMFSSKFSIALDVHSGFGMKDQIWHPWAYSAQQKFPFFDKYSEFKNLFEETYPHHIYRFEAQAVHYTTHGDLWDYLLLEYLKNPTGFFIPLALELGSWIWVKKNPLQLFSAFGLFNPVKEHRYSRTMRRHIYLFDFISRALSNYQYWPQNNHHLS